MSKIGVERASGLFLIAFAALMLWFGRDLPLGQTARMGPGFVPFWVAIAIGAIGIGITVLSIGRRDLSFTPSRPGRVLMILGCILLFAMIVEGYGFVLASFVLVLLSSFSAKNWKLWQSLVLAFALTAFTTVAFVWGLSVPVKTFPW
ncbi:MAG: tripartite tricarboxylate transporter TctB family protein [Neoaquamicrobium sediminum]|uniref:tripartite tricarboxylate transporter TctB family protein n=1 Tax=Neoaquamicrobium sediminum TaxID=1849104 RepID=UPI004036222D